MPNWPLYQEVLTHDFDQAQLGYYLATGKSRDDSLIQYSWKGDYLAKLQAIWRQLKTFAEQLAWLEISYRSVECRKPRCMMKSSLKHHHLSPKG